MSEIIFLKRRRLSGLNSVFLFLLFVWVFFCGSFSFADVSAPGPNPLLGKGDGSATLSGAANVNLNARSQSLHVPLISLPGRGVSLDLSLSYSNNFWNSSIDPYPGRGPSDPANSASISREYFASDFYYYPIVPTSQGAVYPLLPANNLGGWRLNSPAGARLELQVYRTLTGAGTDPVPIFVCSIQYFTYTSPQGVTSQYLPTGPLTGNVSCGRGNNIGGDATVTALLSANAKSIFVNTKGDGTQLVIGNVTKGIQFAPNDNRLGQSVRLIDTQGSFTEFTMLLGPTDAYNFTDFISYNGSRGGSVKLGSGVAVAQGDRFGNFIKIQYEGTHYSGPEPVQNADSYQLSRIRFLDTVGRETIIEYHAQLQFPTRLTVKDYQADGDDFTIDFGYQELTFASSVMDSCLKTTMMPYAGQNPLIYYRNMNFASIQAIRLPNGQSWTFNYDRDWGKAANNRLASDGSLVDFIDPRGLRNHFNLNNDNSNAQLNKLPAFLSPTGNAGSICSRLAHVLSVEEYQPELGLTAFTQFESQITGAASGYAQTGDHIVTVFKYDGSKNLLAREVHNYRRFMDIDFQEVDTKVFGADGSMLLNITKNVDCHRTRLIGIPTIDANGYDGFCWVSSSRSNNDGVVTSSRTLFNQEITFSMNMYSGPFYSKESAPGKNEPPAAAATLRAPVYSLSSNMPFNRPRSVTAFDGELDSRIVRIQETTYNDTYRFANLLVLPKTEISYNANRAIISSHETQYDTQVVANVSLTLAQGFDPTYAVAAGLATTQIDHDPKAVLSDITVSQQFNKSGQVVLSTDARGFSTQFTYAPTGGCDDGFSANGAFLTKTVNPLNQTSTATYYCGSGTLASKTDSNNLTTSYEYDDLLARVTRTKHPGGTYETTRYDDTSRTMTAETYDAGGLFATNTLFKRSVTKFDAFGRPRSVEATNPNGVGNTAVTVQYEYDALGRQSKVSNPYGRMTSREYDALNRLKILRDPSGATLKTEYLGRTTRVTDAHGRIREQDVDFFGNITRVRSEDGLDTVYEYDITNNLQRVIHANKRQTRNFEFDGFNRKISTIIPEQVGAETVLEYDAGGNALRTKTPNGVIVIKTYDALNRLTSKTYAGDPAGTQPVTYTYDVGPAGHIGHLTRLVQGTVSRALTYDSLSRISNDVLTIDNGSYPIRYTYNSLSLPETMVYPNGRVKKIDYNTSANANRYSWSDLNGQANAVSTSVEEYAIHGTVARRKFGNGLTEYQQFDPDQLTLTSRNVQGVMELSFDYRVTPEKCGGSGRFDSAVSSSFGSITEKVGTEARVLTYTYDCLNRLIKASATGAARWDLTFGFDDRYNRTSQVGVNRIAQNKSYDDANRVAGYSYDNNGNILYDGRNTYTFSGDDRLLSSRDPQGKTTTYRYLDDQRVAKTTVKSTTHYVRDISGALISEYTSESSQGAGSELALYYHKDNLGSVRVLTDMRGKITSQRSFYPWGEEETQSKDSVSRKFTSHERDSESGNDYMHARYYSSANASFLSVDRGAPDVHNPMTWNRYVYGNNNPTSFVDTDGNSATVVLDVAATLYDGYQLIKNPSWGNAAWFAADVVSLAIPFVPAPGVVRVAARVGMKLSASIGAESKIVRAAASTAKEVAPIVQEAAPAVLSAAKATKRVVNSVKMANGLANKAFELAKKTNTCGMMCDERADKWALEMRRAKLGDPARVTVASVNWSDLVYDAKRHTWNFHTAPAVKQGGEWYAIDPAWYPEGPVPIKQWAERFGGSPVLHEPYMHPAGRLDEGNFNFYPRDKW